jgi:pimeloyl-ACP methyl ester carboxylesterase
LQADILFESDSRKIAATVITPDEGHESPYALLLGQGYQDDRLRNSMYGVYLARTLGITCLAFDMSGRGDSEGDLTSLTIADHQQDYQNAYDCLAGRVAESTAIFAHGWSYGGYQAAVLSGNRPLAGLILQTPVLYPDDWFNSSRAGLAPANVREFREQITPLSQCLPLNALRNFNKPTLIVAAADDEWVSESVISAYSGAAPRNQLEIMHNATHTLHDTQHEDFQLVLRKWLARVILENTVPTQPGQEDLVALESA